MMSTKKYSTTFTVETDSIDILGKYQQNKSTILSSIIQQYAIKTQPAIGSKMKSAIKTYYDSYKPMLYDRERSLYGVFRFDITSSSYALILDPAFLQGVHRVADDWIYDKMFKEGFHGGAPHNGGMYWRWPSKPIGNIGRYSMWYPWGEALQTAAPYDIAAKDINGYVNTEGAKILYDIICKEIKKLKKGG